MGRLQRQSPGYIRLLVSLHLIPESGSLRAHSHLSVLAAMQTQGYSDNFQRVYPSRESAEAAWRAFQQTGTFPDYGKGPWVVYIGNKPGLAIKV